MKTILWRCRNTLGTLSRYPEMLKTQTSYEFFGGWLSLDRHFRGCETLVIEWTLNGTPWVNFRPFTVLGKITRWRFDLTVRLWVWIITVRRPLTDKWRGVELLPLK